MPTTDRHESPPDSSPVVLHAVFKLGKRRREVYWAGKRISLMTEGWPTRIIEFGKARKGHPVIGFQKRVDPADGTLPLVTLIGLFRVHIFVGSLDSEIGEAQQFHEEYPQYLALGDSPYGEAPSWTIGAVA